MTENDVSYIIRGAIFKVYNSLDPGLLESVYVAALVHGLRKEGLEIKTEVPVPVIYDDEKLKLGFRIDISCSGFSNYRSKIHRATCRGAS